MKKAKKAGARRECPNCGGRMRKGTGTRAMMFDAHGAAAWGIVCAKCIATAVSVVVPKAVTVAPACANKCGGLAAYCAGCYERALAHASELSTANVVLHQAAHAPPASEAARPGDA
jgi:hypothetical protein